MRKVVIVGLGLMGGSLGLALRCRTEDVYVIGYDTSPEVCQEALSLGAVDQIASTAAEAFSFGEVVFLATPIRGIMEYLTVAAQYCPPGSVISDLGSTKEQIVETARRVLPPGVTFIGGHPMAGKERSGITAASPHLFENAAYILTPFTDCPKENLTRLQALVEDTGAFPVILSPQDHDLIVSVVSHLPHLCAVALTLTAGKLSGTYPELLALAAGGFRDTTRVASGDPGLWLQILETNKGHIHRAIEQLKEVLTDLQRALAEDGEVLYERLRAAKVLRDELPRHSRRLTNYYELTVQVADESGAIGAIAGILTEEKINIADIEIMRAREGEAGVLRLGFSDEQQLDQALKALRSRGHLVTRRT